MSLDSISDALSGLQANQTYMDVVGNNIANVNTTAYKTEDVSFADMLNETLTGGSVVNGSLEGTNALQIGMGVGGASTTMLDTQGSVQDTGRLTDMAIQGGGYFTVGNGQQTFYTRDGSFNLAPDGTLEVGSTGMTVQGWTSTNADGSINTTAPLGAIKIPLNSQSAAATTSIALNGNLDASQANYVAGPPTTGGQFSTSITVYDSQGQAHQLSVTLQKTGNNSWSYSIAAPTGSTDITNVSGNTGTLTFDANGKLTAPTTMPSLAITYANGTTAGKVTVDLSNVTQLAQTSQVNVASADGSAGGAISSFSVDKHGTVSAIYSDGTTKPVGQIALASFRNPDGLQKEGNNLYAVGANSGAPQVGTAGTGSLGTILTGQLEGSNVDLAAQFAQMIQAQQGYNANTKVVTTTTSMLQTLISSVQ